MADRRDNSGDAQARAARNASILRPGSILGEYRILNLIGRGGMGEVYHVEHVQMHKHYALKILPKDLSRDSQFFTRFRIEARVMADLDHPNIVRVHYMSVADNRHFLVMDYVEGGDERPRTLLDELRETGRISERRTREIALQICDALVYAHGFRAEGVVHRDLKPANILLDKHGNVRITDFGIAKLLGNEYIKNIIENSLSILSDRNAGTQSGLDTTQRQFPERSNTMSILGTYDYMSPEQKAGDDEVDCRSDIYSFGVILYGMLTGHKPQGAYRPPSRSGVRRAWNRICARSLAPDRHERYPTVRALRADISRVGMPLVNWTSVGVAVGSWALAALLGIQAFRSYTGRRRGARPPGEDGTPALKQPTEGRVAPGPASSVSVPAPNDLDAVKARVEAAWRDLDKMELRDVPGLGPRIKPLEDGMRAAQRVERAGQLTNALVAYRALLAKIGQIAALESQRQRAFRRRTECMAFRGTAAAAGGARHAASRWQQGEESVDRAKTLFAAGEFESAAQAWLTAGQQFHESDREAVAVAAYLEVRSTFETALQRYDEARLRKYGGNAWQEFDAQRQLAEAEAGQPLRGKRAYALALTKLGAAVAAMHRGVAAGAYYEALETGRAALAAARAAPVLGMQGSRVLDEGIAAVTSFEKGFLSGRYSHPGEKEWKAIELLKWDLLEGKKRFLVDLIAVKDGAYVAVRTLPRAGRGAVEVQRNAVTRFGLPLEIRTPKAGLRMRLIPAGSFMMGSPDDERDRDSDEVRHKVVLTKPFYMGRTEVTQRQWRLVMGANPSRFQGLGDDGPVEVVDWTHCQEFLAKLALLEGVSKGTYRLPSEAEWEYACRAGLDAAYPWGDRFKAQSANAENSREFYWNIRTYRKLDIAIGSTGPCARFPPNAWGLYDMIGNVWEWCQDWYQAYPVREVKDPLVADRGAERIARGGSWKDYAKHARSANRYSLLPGQRLPNLGLRVVRILDAVPARRPK